MKNETINLVTGGTGFLGSHLIDHLIKKNQQVICIDNNLTGNIKNLKGDLELVTLKKGDYFGEMALLDGEARSADAVSVNDSILLKLDASDFDKIMYSNDKIVKGILSMLSQRLRKANNLLNKSK